MRGLPTWSPASAPAGRIAVVCGKGNNGGDGLVAARVLRQAGREVDVLAVWGVETLQGDAAEMLERLPGEPPEPFEAGRARRRRTRSSTRCSGTGTTGAPREPAAGVIEAINAAARAGDRRRRAVAASTPPPARWPAGGPRRRHRHLPPRQAGPVDPPRQGPRGRRRGDRHRDPVRRARRARDRPDPAAACSRRCRAAAPESTKFSSGNVFVIGGSLRPDGRAHDGRAGGDARRRRAT